MSRYLALIAAWACCLAWPASAANPDPGFDLLLLVRMWSPTFCEQLRDEHQSCDRNPVNAFTLHGLWPEFAQGGWPQYCRQSDHPSAYLPSASNDEWDHMRCEWPSFHGGSPAFWDHEWTKHGTCAEPLLGNHSAFFNTALKLHEQFDLNQALAPLGIFDGEKPVVSTRVGNEEVAVAVKGAWGVTPRLSCYHGALSEVWVCLDLDLNPIECPPKVGPRSRCPEVIDLPRGSRVSCTVWDISALLLRLVISGQFMVLLVYSALSAGEPGVRKVLSTHPE